MIEKKQALEALEQALNAAIQKGVFADLNSAAYLFQCLQSLKDADRSDNSPNT